MITTQILWIILVVFVLGLFIGTNLGVMLMCVLHLAGQKRTEGIEMAALAIPIES